MTGLQTSEKLLNALTRAAKKKLSESELREQRISFIMGSLDKDSTITREQVSRILAQQEGRQYLILHDIVGTEDHAEYQALEIANVNRQVDFIRSLVEASLNLDKPFLSQQIIKALNYHAITCLHSNAGEYRPCLLYTSPSPRDRG